MYVDAFARSQYAAYEDTPVPDASSEPGALSYIISTICDRSMGFDVTFRELNAIIGVLEGVKQEFYGRVARPYLNSKRVIFGDVFSNQHTNPS